MTGHEAKHASRALGGGTLRGVGSGVGQLAIIGLVTTTGLGTWLATTLTALSEYGWGIYPIVGIVISLAIATIAFMATVILKAWKREPIVVWADSAPIVKASTSSATTEHLLTTEKISPFVFSFSGDSDWIVVECEDGANGRHWAVKFDLINSGPTQAEDVEVYISGTSYFHSERISFPQPFDRVYLTNRRGRVSINPGQMEEYIMMSLNASDDAKPFWGDHRTIPVAERVFTVMGKTPTREGQHEVEIRVSAKNVPSKVFAVKIIVAGGAPTLLPQDPEFRRLVRKR